MNRADPCAAIRDELKPYVDGELGPLRRRAVERHLARCPACRAERAAMDQIGNQLRSLEPDRLDRLDPALRARILAAIPDVTPHTGARPARSRVGRRGLIAAASVAMVAAVAIAVMRGPMQRYPKLDRATAQREAPATYASGASAKHVAAPEAQPRAGRPVQVAKADLTRAAIAPVVDAAGGARSVAEGERPPSAHTEPHSRLAEPTQETQRSAEHSTALSTSGDKLPAARSRYSVDSAGASGRAPASAANGVVAGGLPGLASSAGGPQGVNGQAGAPAAAAAAPAAAAGTNMYAYGRPASLKDQIAADAVPAGALTLDVAALDEARSDVARIVRASGGTAEPEVRGQGGDSARRETLLLRLPADAYETTYRKLAALGQKVEPRQEEQMQQERGMARQREALDGQPPRRSVGLGLSYGKQPRSLAGAAGGAPGGELREQVRGQVKAAIEPAPAGAAQQPAQSTPMARAPQEMLRRSRALSKAVPVRTLTLVLRETPGAHKTAAGASAKRTPAAKASPPPAKKRR